LAVVFSGDKPCCLIPFGCLYTSLFPCIEEVISGKENISQDKYMNVFSSLSLKLKGWAPQTPEMINSLIWAFLVTDADGDEVGFSTFEHPNCIILKLNRAPP
jgi:hypothetical protein